MTRTRHPCKVVAPSRMTLAEYAREDKSPGEQRRTAAPSTPTKRLAEVIEEVVDVDGEVAGDQLHGWTKGEIGAAVSMLLKRGVIEPTGIRRRSAKRATNGRAVYVYRRGVTRP